MATTVPRVTGPSVQVQDQPNVQASARLSPDYADSLVHGMGVLGGAIRDIAEQEQQKSDLASVLEAQRKLSDYERTLFNPENPQGVYAKKGRDALGLVEKIAPDYDRIASELTNGLKSEKARLTFQQHVAGRRDSTLDRINGYQVQEFDGYRRAEFKARTEGLARDASAAMLEGDRGAFNQRLSEGLAAIRAQGSVDGEAREVTEAREDALLDTVMSTTTLGFLVGGRVEDADRFLRDHEKHMTPEAIISVRSKLQPALDEHEDEAAIEAIDSGQSPARAVTPDYGAQRDQLESGGDPNAVNPRSSATGPHQFIEDTWTRLVSQYKPKWAQGLSREALLELRRDPVKSAEMVRHFDRENEGVLRRAGVEVTNTSMYLAHHFGAAGAVKIARAPDGTPMSKLVDAEAYAANPHLHGKTKADVLAGFRRRGLSDAPAAGSVTLGSTEETIRVQAGETLSQKLARADAVYSDDPKRAGRVKTGLRERERQRKEAEAEQKEGVVSTVLNAVESADPRTLPGQLMATVPGVEALDYAERVKLEDTVRVLQEHKVRGTFVQDDLRLVEEFQRQRVEHPDQFAKRNLDIYRADLSTGTLAELKKSQAEITKPGKWEEARTEEQLLASTYVQLGLTGPKKLTDRQFLRDKYVAEVKGFIDSHNGRKPSEGEREVIVGRLLVWGARNVTSWPLGVTSRERKRVYQLKPEEMRSNNPNGFEVAFSPRQQTAALAILQRAGVPPTAANIRRVILERGGKL